jgi:hypothetical protein
VTRAQRLRAARLCSIAASTPGFCSDYGWNDIPGMSGPDFDRAFNVWLDAWVGVTTQERWAAAEAVLRTGGGR